MSAAFPGILVYLVLWLVIPKQNQSNTANYTQGYTRPVRTVNADQDR